jgi:hypothetical protein
MLIVKTKVKGEYVNITAYKPYSVTANKAAAPYIPEYTGAKPSGW